MLASSGQTRNRSWVSWNLPLAVYPGDFPILRVFIWIRLEEMQVYVLPSAMLYELKKRTLRVQTSRPNAPSCNVNESEKQCGSTWWFGWSAPKLNGLFLGQCYTHPPNWMKIGPLVFAQTCWQTQTNCVANITSLAEVTREELWKAVGSKHEVVMTTLTET